MLRNRFLYSCGFLQTKLDFIIEICLRVKLCMIKGKYPCGVRSRSYWDKSQLLWEKYQGFLKLCILLLSFVLLVVFSTNSSTAASTSTSTTSDAALQIYFTTVVPTLPPSTKKSFGLSETACMAALTVYTHTNSIARLASRSCRSSGGFKGESKIVAKGVRNSRQMRASSKLKKTRQENTAKQVAFTDIGSATSDEEVNIVCSVKSIESRPLSNPRRKPPIVVGVAASAKERPMGLCHTSVLVQ